MRYAIISDVHANLEALEAVLKEIDSLTADRIVCLGDTVGYGANPNECTEIIRDRAGVAVLGNHDQAATDGTSVEWFNTHARAAIIWTKEVLKPECAEFLKNLPYTASIDGARLVHANPSEPGGWNYIFEPTEASYEFRCFDERVCFIGHSHFPLFFVKEGRSCKAVLPEPLKLEQDKRYIVNVGSVGQPRDHVPAASFATLDLPEGIVEFRRVEYDRRLAYEKILKAGLPRFLAERLLVGE
ncbi:MAG: metallophosphoesterase family protein [Candidatus Eisenbacteria bacterium]|nr:metallophosphoesterase family protein [Candidatus Eisenbacteria bacterium]